MNKFAIGGRFREPSSWAGAAAIFQGLAYFFPQYAAIITAAAAVLGAVAVKMPETGAGGGPGGGD